MLTHAPRQSRRLTVLALTAATGLALSFGTAVAPAMAAPAVTPHVAAHVVPQSGAAAAAMDQPYAGYVAGFSGSGTVAATQVVATAQPQFATSRVTSEVGFQGSGWDAYASLTYVSSTNRVLYQVQVGNSAIDVNAGDTLRMSMTWHASTSRWSGRILDTTTGAGVHGGGSESSAPDLSFVDMARWPEASSYLPIPVFSPTAFTRVTVQGVPLASAPRLTQEEMTSTSGQRLVTAGPVTTAAFTETFVSSTGR